MSKPALPSEVVRIARKLYLGLGTPLNLKLAAMLDKGDWDGISGVSPDPRSYSTAKDYFFDAAGAALLRKCQGLPTTHNRKENAIKKWREGEISCYRANERLTRFLPEFRNHHLSSKDERIRDFLSLVRKEILSWLGSSPPDLIEGRFGPGSTFSDRGRYITVPDKIANVPSLTRDAIWYLPQWLGTQWGSTCARHHGEVSFVPGNRFTTAPKTSVTDRAIAAEPGLNVFCQLAYGRLIRQGLKRATGWDLDRAQEMHGRMARLSSVTREYATLDLSNASDTVCRNLVKILLPRRWFEALNSLRSPKTLINGRWYVLEKFSSMGNGFTFELETLIFAAICCVVTRMSGYKGKLGEDVFVFGDDIIVKDDCVSTVKSILEFCGFSLNLEKSFFGDTPFRESCGQDFFDGKSVRPYFLKELPNGPQDYIAFANGIQRNRQIFADFGVDPCLPSWFSVLDCIPTRVRNCRGPQDLGDLVIHDEPSTWTVRYRNSIRYLRTLKPGRRRLVNVHSFNDEVILACATYGVSSAHPKGWAWHSLGGVVPRDGVLSYKVGWTPYS